MAFEPGVTVMQPISSRPSRSWNRLSCRARLVVASAVAASMFISPLLAQQPGGRPALPSDPALPAVPKPIPVPAPAAVPTDSAPQDGVGQAEATDARIAAAQRMAQAAYEIVQGDKTARHPAAWRQAVVYLEAARRLNPEEPRYPRLQAEAYSQLGDFEGSASALEAYLQLRGDDDTARLKLIEYYVARMQTVDAKLKYLSSLLERPTVSNELKSRCATFAAVLLGERSVRQQVEMTDKALSFDPLNIYARRLEYAQLQQAGAGPADRVRSLFAQLRCNPVQIAILENIGREMAAAGLVRDSLDWMASAKNLSIYLGQPDPEFFVDYSAQLFINGLTKEAEEGVGLVLQAEPRNVEAWFVLLTLRRSAGLQVALDQDTDRAKTVLGARVGAIASRIQQAGATAASSGSGAPDFTQAFAPSGGTGNAAANAGNESAPTGDRLKAVIDVVKAPTTPQPIRNEFISAVTDLAWFEVYFNRSATGARTWIDALSQLLPADDLALVRLRGWFELLENRQAEAMRTLWAIRDRDALAAMGVSRMLGQGNWAAAGGAATRPASQDPIQTAQNLLNKFPYGLLGAMMVAEFKDRKLTVQPQPVAAELRKLASDFPVELLQIIVQPDRFYVPIGDATKLPYRLGEPMIANVTLRNLSEFDLPIGPEGIIKPDLWFDSRVSLGEERLFPMTAYDKVSGPLVLKRKSSASQQVRVDHGEMARALRERPAASVNVFMTVMTNPMVRADYRVIAGPGGVRQQFSRSLIRGGMPVFNEPQRKKLLEGLKGLPNEKLWTIDVLAAFVQQSRGIDAEENVQRLVPDFLEQIRNMQKDRVPQVAAFATFALLGLQESGNVAERVKLIETLATSQAWEGRLAAVWAARDLPAAERKRVVGTLTNDADELVKQAATLDLTLADAATTQPSPTPATTQPSPTDPGEGPALPPSGLNPLPLPGQ